MVCLRVTGHADLRAGWRTGSMLSEFIIFRPPQRHRFCVIKYFLCASGDDYYWEMKSFSCRVIRYSLSKWTSTIFHDISAWATNRWDLSRRNRPCPKCNLCLVFFSLSINSCPYARSTWTTGDISSPSTVFTAPAPLRKGADSFDYKRKTKWSSQVDKIASVVHDTLQCDDNHGHFFTILFSQTRQTTEPTINYIPQDMKGGKVCIL